ncbi:MAG TPA: ATP-dependent helicase HrpB [Bacteroidia bacterium]|nr:ATP-dependent helicase HrpB [Bacteroidia bacterium]
MAFDPYSIELPVREIIPELCAKLAIHNTLVLSAPPGAGKSTLLPLALRHEPWLEGKKILMLEPRRLAARSVALRMAKLLEEEIGQGVGYRIRFETHVGKHTKLEVLTEGILTRMLQDDNALEDVGLVIFDEFHERSLNADLALALCRDVQAVLRPDLRILIMSATLNTEELCRMLQAPSIIAGGRMFPVDVHYSQDADLSTLPELAARTVLQAMRQHPGDALIFLPGEAEIRRCEDLLKNQHEHYSLHPLYGMLPAQEQYKAIMPHPLGKRKIVIATSIAETSLTIEGVRIVVDSGYTRRSTFDPSSGMSKLETFRISNDSAEQRAGRAGRMSRGVCYRMWSTATQSRLAAHRVPEILEADLCDMLLDLAQWGVHDPLQLFWINTPPKASLAQASELLHQIGALVDDRITPHGKALHKLACHPRIAHMLLMTASEEEKQLACDLAAILEDRDPLSREDGVDITLRVEALRQFRNRNTMPGRFTRIAKASTMYHQMLGIGPSNGLFDAYNCGLLLAYAYPERIASARQGNNAQFQLSNGRIAGFSHQDSLARESWLAVANVDVRDGVGKIFLAAPLNPQDLIHLVQEEDVLSWDTRNGGLIAQRETRIGNLVLRRKAINDVPEAKRTELLARVIEKEGASLLDFNSAMEQLQNRILSLKLWNTEENWPDASTTGLLRDVSWLKPYLGSVKKPEDLKKINLAEALLLNLSWEQQQELQVRAPGKLQVPSGSGIPLQYYSNGGSPIMAVRLQEIFGLAETPRVNGGKIAVVMHLLSPGYKPVQITSDLKSFWNSMYFEVKKELKRRYPKHAWPDDPWTAPAIAKGRNQKS